MIDVVCGVIEGDDGRILACRRAFGSHLGGLWEFPGGKVEPGETPEVALVRELREELAIEAEAGEPLTPVDWDYGRGPFRLLPIRCRILDGEPTLLEHSELRWCSAKDFHQLAWAAADIPVLTEVFPINRNPWD